MQGVECRCWWRVDIAGPLSAIESPFGPLRSIKRIRLATPLVEVGVQKIDRSDGQDFHGKGQEDNIHRDVE